jgi:hypothetical protein
VNPLRTVVRCGGCGGHAAAQHRRLPPPAQCAAQAFDGVHDHNGTAPNFWRSAAAGMPQWLQYDFAAPVVLCSYAIRARHGARAAAEAPRDWRLLAAAGGALSLAGPLAPGVAVLDVQERRKFCMAVRLSWSIVTRARVPRQEAQLGWGRGERRPFALIPAGAFAAYRLHVTAAGSG